MGSNPTLSARSFLFVALSKRLIPAPFLPLARSLYHGAYRRRFGVEWWIRDRLERDPTLPPSKLRFRVGESCDPAVFLDVGRRTAQNIGDCLNAAGLAMAADAAALDFGCGCGRTLRWFTRQFPSVKWHGCDVDAEAIAWCRANLPGRYEVNAPGKPIPFSDASFDLVFAVSVFTHVDEEFQRGLVPELMRILKPGGALLVSVYSEHVWRATRDAGAIERGEFVFQQSAKLKGIVPEWYHTAFQSRERILRLLDPYCASVRYMERGLGDQDAVIGVK